MGSNPLVWKNSIDAFRTAGVLPNSGRMNFANIGWTRNTSPALRKSVTEKSAMIVVSRRRVRGLFAQQAHLPRERLEHHPAVLEAQGARHHSIDEQRSDIVAKTRVNASGRRLERAQNSDVCSGG